MLEVTNLPNFQHETPWFFFCQGTPGRQFQGGSWRWGKESPNWNPENHLFTKASNHQGSEKSRTSSRVWPLSRIVLENGENTHTHVYIYISYIYISIIYLYKSIYVFDMIRYDKKVSTGRVDFYLNSAKNHHWRRRVEHEWNNRIHMNTLIMLH